MNTYERLVLENKIAEQERVMENLDYRLKNAKNDMVKALAQNAKMVEGQKLANLKAQLV